MWHKKLKKIKKKLEDENGKKNLGEKKISKNEKRKSMGMKIKRPKKSTPQNQKKTTKMNITIRRWKKWLQILKMTKKN